jgi:hypothetical protein
MDDASSSCAPYRVGQTRQTGEPPRKAAHYRRRLDMYETATTRALRLRKEAARKARVALAAAVLAAALVVPPLVVGLVASPAHAETTFLVTNTNDSGAGSLRQAILDVNANNNPSVVDKITFDIPGTGVHTISPDSPLPFTPEPVNINGYTQPGSSANTLAKGTNARPLIQINGTNSGASGSIGGININASNSVVKGLIINRFADTQGIAVGPMADASVPDEVVTNVRIEGNFVGTDPSGTISRGNAAGVNLFAASDSTVGGTSLASRNLISGNELSGVFIEGGGDRIGFGSSDNNEVRGNLVGTQKDGLKPLGNGFSGVDVFEDAPDSAHGNSILSNSIFANGGLGIDLGSNGTTANDALDADSGANELQNKPVLGSAKTVSGKTTIRGTLSTFPGNDTYTIQFFSNPSGNEGRTFLGQKTGVAVDPQTGKGSFSFSPTTKVAVGQTITATATNEFTGDTSEFSGTRTVASS